MREMDLKTVLMVASINCFSFLCHPTVSSYVREHKNQQKNHRPVLYGYLAAAILYTIAGTGGALAIEGKHHPGTK